MKLWKKMLALGLAAVMTLSMAACGGQVNPPAGDGTPAPTGTENPGQNTPAPAAPGEKNEEITIGSWWLQYYDSSDSVLEDDPAYEDAIDQPDDDEATKKQNAISRQIAQMKLDNVDYIEKTFGVEFYWENLTWAGVTDSINTSIMAGTPDCDIYMLPTDLIAPAHANGLALDLKTVLPADHDLFTTQETAGYLDFGDGKATIFYQVTAEGNVAGTYPLAFNMQMLEDNNLEDPRELYKRGEWTWDKFIEYCQVLTQDTDGDGQVDQYGYCGYELETMEGLMFGNGATIAASATEGLSSAATGQVLQMFYDMYNTYNVCYPYDYEGSPSDSMRNQYTEGNIGFFPIAAWIQSGNGDYDYDGSLGYTLPFDIAYVRWPIGPSGNQETNYARNTISGVSFYMIPVGCPEPEKVFNVMWEYWNWCKGDLSIRDSKEALNWWYKVTSNKEELQNANFDVMYDCGAHSVLDLWNSLGVSLDLQYIMKGEKTAAQVQEEHKQEVQDALDAYYGN